MSVDFNEFQSLFDDTWDMAYLSHVKILFKPACVLLKTNTMCLVEIYKWYSFSDITHGIVMCKFGESWGL